MNNPSTQNAKKKPNDITTPNIPLKKPLSVMWYQAAPNLTTALVLNVQKQLLIKYQIDVLTINELPFKFPSFNIVPDNIEAVPEPKQLITIDNLAPNISTKKPLINTEIPYEMLPINTITP